MHAVIYSLLIDSSSSMEIIIVISIIMSTHDNKIKKYWGENLKFDCMKICFFIAIRCTEIWRGIPLCHKFIIIIIINLIKEKLKIVLMTTIYVPFAYPKGIYIIIVICPLLQTVYNHSKISHKVRNYLNQLCQHAYNILHHWLLFVYKIWLVYWIYTHAYHDDTLNKA